jgi:hypothetical protein
MQKQVPIPDVTILCEQCEENTSFQLALFIDVEKEEGVLTTEVSGIWFCTQCHDQQVGCEFEPGRVV